MANYCGNNITILCTENELAEIQNVVYNQIINLPATYDGWDFSRNGFFGTTAWSPEPLEDGSLKSLSKLFPWIYFHFSDDIEGVPEERFDELVFNNGVFYDVFLEELSGKYDEFCKTVSSYINDTVRRYIQNNCNKSLGLFHNVELDESIVAKGDNKFNQCDVNKWKNVKQVSTGEFHTIALLSDGTLLATGSNANSQCDVSKLKNVKQISCGRFHTAVLLNDGTVKIVGINLDSDTNYKELSKVKDYEIIKNNSAKKLFEELTKILINPYENNNLPNIDCSFWKDIVEIKSIYDGVVGIDKDDKCYIYGMTGCTEEDLKSIFNKNIAIIDRIEPENEIIDLNQFNRIKIWENPDKKFNIPDDFDGIQYEEYQFYVLELSKDNVLSIKFDRKKREKLDWIVEKDILIYDLKLKNVRSFKINFQSDAIFAHMYDDTIKIIQLIKVHEGVKKWNKICQDIEDEKNIKDIYFFFEGRSLTHGIDNPLVIHNDGTSSYYNGKDNSCSEFEKIKKHKIDTIICENFAIDFDSAIIPLRDWYSELSKIKKYDQIETNYSIFAIHLSPGKIVTEGIGGLVYFNKAKKFVCFEPCPLSHDFLVLDFDGTIHCGDSFKYNHEKEKEIIFKLNQNKDKDQVKDLIVCIDRRDMYNTKYYIISLHNSGDVRLNGELLNSNVKAIEYKNGKVFGYFNK